MNSRLKADKLSVQIVQNVPQASLTTTADQILGLCLGDPVNARKQDTSTEKVS
jgi:hypothetical protein